MANIKDLEELLRRVQEAKNAVGPVGEGSDIVPGLENLKDGEDSQSSDYTNQIFSNMNKEVPNPNIIDNVPEYAPYGKIKDVANSNYPNINNEGLTPDSTSSIKPDNITPENNQKLSQKYKDNQELESNQTMLKDTGIPSSMDMKTENTNSLLQPEVRPDTPLLTDIERSFNEYKLLKGDNSSLRDSAVTDAFTGFGQDFAKYNALAGNAAAMSASNQLINPKMLKFDNPKSLERAQKEYDNKLKLKAKEISDLRKLEKTKGLTTYQLTQIKLRQQELANKATRENRIQNDQLLRRKRGNNKDIYGVVNDFENDNVVKELKKQNISFGQAESLLIAMENDNKVALGALGTKLARAMGEVGVLTDADVVRYINRYDVSGKVLDYFSGKFNGKVSDITQKDLKDIVEIFKLGSKKNIKSVRTKYIDYAYNNFGKDAGYSKTEVNKRFGIDTSPKSKEQKSKEQTPNEQKRKTKDGKIAVFDSNTKKFLRYE